MQGDVIAIVDKDAQTVARYSYDAWGAIASAITYTELTEGVDIATINPFRYRGYYYDEEIGMYYLQSRYYNPDVGRFVNGDDVIITCAFSDTTSSLNHNLFAYCINSPVFSIDSQGTKSGYIDDQTNFYGSSYTFGVNKTTVAKAGCGYVAVYNVIRKYSSKISFKKILKTLYSSGGLSSYIYNRRGVYGLSIFSIIDYFRSKFWIVRYYIGSWKWRWRYIADHSDAIIVSYNHKSGAGHYVAGVKERYDFRFYNCTIKYDHIDYTRKLSDSAVSIDDFFYILKAGKKTRTSIIGVKYKKWWW